MVCDCHHRTVNQNLLICRPLVRHCVEECIAELQGCRDINLINASETAVNGSSEIWVTELDYAAASHLECRTGLLARTVVHICHRLLLTH